MRFKIFLLFGLVFFISCVKSKERTFNSSETLKTDTIQYLKVEHENRFTTFLGIDSIAVFDKSIQDTIVDSIDTRKITFDAKYIGCFKAKVKKWLYKTLESTAPDKYSQILKITTDHEIFKDGTSYHFHGLHSIDCDYSKNSDIIITSTLYTLYSNSNLLGRILIIDSINMKNK